MQTIYGNQTEISIHAAREGGDATSFVAFQIMRRFQSTPPVKAATKTCGAKICAQKFQSTPPVKAATRKSKHKCRRANISIHAAREGGDISVC